MQCNGVKGAVPKEKETLNQHIHNIVMEKYSALRWKQLSQVIKAIEVYKSKLAKTVGFRK